MQDFASDLYAVHGFLPLVDKTATQNDKKTALPSIYSLIYWKRPVPDWPFGTSGKPPEAIRLLQLLPRCTRRGWRLFRGYALTVYTNSSGSGSGVLEAGVLQGAFTFSSDRATPTDIASIFIAVQGCSHFDRGPIPLNIQQVLHGTLQVISLGS